MTQITPSFNEIEDIIISLAVKHGESVEKIKSPTWKFRDLNWQWILKGSNQQELFDKDMFLLSEAISLYKKALDQDDLLAAKNGIMTAQLAAQNLSGFFDSMMSDMRMVMRNSEDFKWPEFPDPYEVPESYNYKGL